MSPPVRVAHVVDQLTPAGAQRVLLGNLRGLDPTIVRSVVYAVFAPDEMGPDVRALGIRTVWLGARGARDFPLAILRLWRHLRRDPVDIVHTQTPPADTCGRLAARLAGIPVLSTFQNPVNESTRHLGLSGRVQNWLQWLTYRVSGASAIAVSEGVRRSVHRSLGDRDAVVIRNAAGIDLARWPEIGPAERAERRREFGYAEDSFVFGNIARLDPQKAQDRLLDALDALTREGHDVHLLLVGDGPLRVSLADQAARLGIAARVRVTGWVDDPRRFVAACDALVASSRFEGDSLVLFEGMSTGLPYVTTAVGSAPEVIRDGVDALLVPEDMPTRLVGAMRRLVADPELRRALGTSGRERAHTVCDAHASLRGLEQVYATLARRQRH